MVYIMNCDSTDPTHENPIPIMIRHIAAFAFAAVASLAALPAWGADPDSDGPLLLVSASYQKDIVALCESDGTVIWKHRTGGPKRGHAGHHEVQMLPSGNVLYHDDWNVVKEIQLDGKEVWRYVSDNVHAFTRLPNGNTMIAESGRNRIIIVNRQGELVRETPLGEGGRGKTRQAEALPNGNYLVCAENPGTVTEYELSGKIVWEYEIGSRVYGAIRLQNGNTLICSGSGNSVVEVTPKKEVVWEAKQKIGNIALHWTASLKELPNGHVIINNCHAGADNPQLFELDKQRNIVWQFNEFELVGNGMACFDYIPRQQAAKIRRQVAALESRGLHWSELPSLPNRLGVAGPFAGVHRDALMVAGGANFPQPVWGNDKVWHDEIYVLPRGRLAQWRRAGKLPRPTGYGAAVSTAHGVLCMGGNDAQETFADTFLLQWGGPQGHVRRSAGPALPSACAYGAAAVIGDTVYLAGGQSGPGLESAMSQLWSLDLAPLSRGSSWEELRWKRDDCPWPSRAFNLTVAQKRGNEPRLYVAGGRRQQGEQVEFLRDVWEFNPVTETWRRCADAPRNVAAGTAAATADGRIAVLGGATGALFLKADALRDKHPGFPKKSLLYDPVQDRWTEGGPTPANHVTTIAVRWGSDIIVPSGEVRPRVRSPKIYRVSTNDD